MDVTLLLVDRTMIGLVGVRVALPEEESFGDDCEAGTLVGLLLEEELEEPPCWAVTTNPKFGSPVELEPSLVPSEVSSAVEMPGSVPIN